jgi:hypothetical protein
MPAPLSRKKRQLGSAAFGAALLCCAAGAGLRTAPPERGALPGAGPITAGAGPITAAEAAQLARAGERAASDPDAAPCAADADCALTSVPKGGCCPTLCSPRAVTRARAAALDAGIGSCDGGGKCPQPLCLPPRARVVPACEAGRCVERTETARPADPRD